MSLLLKSIRASQAPKLPVYQTTRSSTPNAVTANGALTHSTSGNPLLDLFFTIAASRGKDITLDFVNAYNHDNNLALRMLLWARDCRGGAGERQTFRSLFRHLTSVNAALATLLLPKIPELGRWDDVLAATFGTSIEAAGFGMYAAALHSGNGLAAKWCPRKGQIAEAFRKHLELTPKRYRKLIVGLSNTVEQKMCSKEWDKIEYSKIPSIAASRYSKAFTKHDEKRYNSYIEALEKNEAKINASSIFPHDIVVNCLRGNTKIANEQWRRLPDVFSSTKPINIIPIVDVSGSMTCRLGGNPSSVVTCLDVSVALGVYCAERMPGIFKNHFITFSDNPSLQELNGKNLYEKIQNLQSTEWAMSTNLQASFKLILDTAIENNLKNEDLPTHILILSDMEFNTCGTNTNYNSIMKKYENSGYKLPKIVFWNLNARAGNVPVKMHDENTALISGYSPAVMKGFLADPDNISPLKVMEDTLKNSRYDF